MSKIILPRIEIDIINKCNLNCASCTHFSPLVKNIEKYEITQFEKDIKRISELFNLRVLVLLGGEPLLHEDISQLLEISFKYLPDTNIQIYTNGILKNKIVEIKQNFPKVTIIQSKYPIVDFSKESVKLNNKQYFVHPSIDLTGEQDSFLAFQNCHSKGCISLYNGRIYLCPVVRNIFTFEDYFNIKINLDVNNYSIDIHTNDAEQIIQFLNKPSYDCCRYCSPEHEKIPWKLSQKKITEWVKSIK